MTPRSHGMADLFDGVIVDNFAGGGGASLGIEQAMRRPVDVAINHDAAAIAMHEKNHPYTRHLHSDVWEVDPIEATRGRPVALAWFSPDCRHHSKAKGGKPVSKKIRGLAWVVLKWAAAVKPSVIMLENVEEFADWGPLTRSGRPCKRRRGSTFGRWKSQLEALGYAIEHRELRACDYGAPTIRKRLFLIARCDGQAICWPAPTHGEGLEPYRTAAEIIDWSHHCPSIFSRYRPLAENTMRRIAQGLQRFVFDEPQPFLVPVTHPGDSRVYDINKPPRTVPSAALVAAFLAQHNTGMVGHRTTKPLSTITGKGSHQQLVTSHLLHLRNNSYGADAREPVPTITAGGTHLGEVRAFLLKYYGTAVGQPANEPLHSVTPRARFGLVMVHGEPYQLVDIGMRMLTPAELFAAQGFPPDYLIEGFTKTDQTRMCGNSVCPPLARAIVEANFNQSLRERVIAWVDAESL